MPDLSFHVESATVVPFTAAPLLSFRVRVTNAGTEPVHSISLRCQIQIEATRRQYTAEEQVALRDLFGESERWGQTLRTMLWTHVSTVVPDFVGATVVDLQIPCTFDFNIAVVKYFYGLEDGDIPLCFQFSGGVFFQTSDGQMLIAPISWDKETPFRLPVKTWKQMMDMHYPNSAWLYLRRDVFERLYQYKVRRGVPTWEQALDDLLNRDAEQAPS